MSCQADTNFCVNQGSDFVKTLTFTDSTGALVDLTGYSFAGKARASIQSPTSYSFTFTISNQVTNKGEVVWLIPNTLFSALVLTQNVVYVYDVEMTDTTPYITRILKGNLTIVPEVTR